MRSQATIKHTLAIASFVLASQLAATLNAGAQTPTGTLRGEVQDSGGGRIPAAAIVVQAAGSAVRRELESDSRGEFRADNLLPGLYDVRVEARGFAEARSEVIVAVSSVQEITVTMSPAPVQQSVQVQGQVSSITSEPLDTASAVHQGVVTGQDLENIPLAHRSFANIAFLVPGTEPVEPSDPTKARITAVSNGGSSGLNVEASVDGGDNSDDFIGGFLQNFSPDAIQEFAVRTAQEDADTSRTTGASVVITTKRGTDQWRGDAAFYERAAALNARFPIENPAPNPKQPFSRQNYIGTIGGPIKRDKLWMFSSFEYVHEDASIAYSPASQSQFQALSGLAAQGLIPGVSAIGAPSSVAIPFRDYLGTLRWDWAQSATSQWFARASMDRYSTQNDLVQQGTLPSTGATSRSSYLNLVIGNQYTFGPAWAGSFTFAGSGLHRSEARNSNFGFALAFPFSATSQTVSGFETFGDQQFVTPVTAFPVLRNQEKYQFRYDLSHTDGPRAPRAGVSIIHEPVLSGALPGSAETLIAYDHDPSFYAVNPGQFFFSPMCQRAPADPNISCTFSQAGNGSFAQNVQRLGVYAEDSWRVRRNLTVNYGLRYDTTFGLFTASGRSQAQNPIFQTLAALQVRPPVSGLPHDYHAALGPRLGVAYSPGQSGNTVVRAGIGLYYNDLAQNGWVSALQAVNTPLSVVGPCSNPTNSMANNSGCVAAAATGGNGFILDPHYKTPYALHATAGVEHALGRDWTVSADWTHEQGVHSYARYNYQAGFTLFTPLFPAGDTADQRNTTPNVTVFRSDNRSRYDGMSIRVQGNVSRRFNLIAHYTLASAKTWGCVLGEIFDYVDGVCNPLDAFGPGDYGPSGEDVRHRLVVAGTLYVPGGFELTTLSQFESARPFTLTTPVDVNGLGDSLNDRAVINGVQTTLDQFRGAAYIQADMRVERRIKFGERLAAIPFIEFFNLFNRGNPGANFVTSVSALGVNNPGNATALCQNASCTQTRPISSLNQLREPAGALGDFFGPGTTVGIPFAAQFGLRVTF